MSGTRKNIPRKFMKYLAPATLEDLRLVNTRKFEKWIQLDQWSIIGEAVLKSDTKKHPKFFKH